MSEMGEAALGRWDSGFRTLSPAEVGGDWVGNGAVSYSDFAHFHRHIFLITYTPGK